MRHTVRMVFGRFPARALAASVTLLAACGGSNPELVDSTTTTTITDLAGDTAATTVTISSVSTVVDSVDEAPTTTTPATTTTSTASSSEPEPIPVPEDGLVLVSDVDREVSLTTVIVADNDGNLLGTRLDPEGLGCEATPISYFVTVSADGTIEPTSTSTDQFQYAGSVAASPNQRQVLEVDNCEGFLGAVTLYDIDPALKLTNPVEIDTRDALAGDAAWNSDGFITLTLSNEPGFYSDPLEEGEVPVPPQIDEYLVNPRNGDSTQSGSLDQLNYGAYHLADGRSVHVQYGQDPGVFVTDRSGQAEKYEATGFSVSPDATRMLVWDPVFDLAENGQISLVDLESGEVTPVADGLGFAVVWRDDSARLAYSIGSGSVVLDLASGESIAVGEAERSNCATDDFVAWGRVPLAFAPNGDLYVGDVVCGRSSEGMPTVEYRLRQLTLS